MNASHRVYQSPQPALEIPRIYNAAQDLLSRHKHRQQKTAYIDASTGDTLTFGQLNDQAHRFAQGLIGLSLIHI